MKAIIKHKTMESETNGLMSRETEINPIEETIKPEAREEAFDARAHLEQIASEAKESILKSEYFQDFIKNLHPDNAEHVISVINKNMQHSAVSKSLRLVKNEIGDLLPLANGDNLKSEVDLNKEVLALARQTQPLVEDSFTPEKILKGTSGYSKDQLEARIKELESTTNMMRNTPEKALLQNAISVAKTEIKKAVN